MSWNRRRTKIALAVSVPALAAMVALHTPTGRALLGAGGCPWGGAPPSAERLEDFRVKSAQPLKATAVARAPSRPAFGFVLDKSTKAEVLAWGKTVGAPCSEEVGGAALRCEPANGVPVRDAFFRFDPRGVLVGVDVMRDGMGSEKAASMVKELSDQLARDVGPPSAAVGSATPASLDRYLDRAATEFRFADYAADVSATNMGEQGVVVREQYRSIPN